MSLSRHINRLHQPSEIFQLSFAAQAAEMAHGSTSYHAAQTLEVRSPQKPVGLEVVAQPSVNLFIGQAFEFQTSFQAFHFESSEFILQLLVCTEFDGFQFHFRSFALGIGSHRLGSGQAGIEVTDTVKMHLPAFGKFLAHDVRKGIEHSADIGFCQ